MYIILRSYYLFSINLEYFVIGLLSRYNWLIFNPLKDGSYYIKLLGAAKYINDFKLSTDYINQFKLVNFELFNQIFYMLFIRGNF